MAENLARRQKSSGSPQVTPVSTPIPAEKALKSARKNRWRFSFAIKLAVVILASFVSGVLLGVNISALPTPTNNTPSSITTSNTSSSSSSSSDLSNNSSNKQSKESSSSSSSNTVQQQQQRQQQHVSGANSSVSKRSSSSGGGGEANQTKATHTTDSASKETQNTDRAAINCQYLLLTGDSNTRIIREYMHILLGEDFGGWVDVFNTHHLVSYYTNKPLDGCKLVDPDRQRGKKDAKGKEIEECRRMWDDHDSIWFHSESNSCLLFRHRFMRSQFDDKQFDDKQGFRHLNALGELRACFDNKEWFCDLQLDKRTFHPPSNTGEESKILLRVPAPSAAPDLVLAAHGVWGIIDKRIPLLSSEERFKEQTSILDGFTKRNVPVRWMTNFPINGHPSITNQHIHYDRHAQGEVAKKHGLILCDLYHAVTRQKLNVVAGSFHLDEQSALRLGKAYLDLFFDKKEPSFCEVGPDSAAVEWPTEAPKSTTKA
eukprot:g78727.t1